MKRIHRLVLCLCLAALVGCQTAPTPPGTDTPTPLISVTPAPTLTPSPPPTATATLTPTPTPTPQPTARLGLGDQALLNGDYALAQSEFRGALTAADAETRAAALLGLGRTQLLLKEYDQAAKSLNQVITDYPTSRSFAPAYFVLGQTLTALNNIRPAVDAYAAFVKARPGLLDAYIHELRGDLLLKANDFNGALQAYNAALQAEAYGDTEALQLKVGRMYATLGDQKLAVRWFMAVYDTSKNDYYRATANLLAGQAYLALKLPEQAYARFQDSVNRFPQVYDTYVGLVTLVNDNQPVDEYTRGLVDYYAGQYGYAIEAFNRSLTKDNPNAGAAHYYKALSLRALEQPAAALAELNVYLTGYPKDERWIGAWEQKADLLWRDLQRHEDAANTLLDFVKRAPGDPEAPWYLFLAARIYERGEKLDLAAAAWERTMSEYPASEWGFRGLILAGVTQYRLGKFPQALVIFQRGMVLSANPVEQSTALMWVGKTQQAQNNLAAAKTAWESAAQRDPTGYYSERSAELLRGSAPYSEPVILNTSVDLVRERALADNWVSATFSDIPANMDMTTPGDLANELRWQRGEAFWEVGLYAEARQQFESLRQANLMDPLNSYRILNLCLQRGMYRTAILSARNVLDLAGLGDAETLTAPAYFSHVRFGLYYSSSVLAAAQNEKITPLLLFSLIRQESLFEGFSESGAGARGLMQLIPTTGAEVARNMGWPPSYTTADLDRPVINIVLGARYLARQRDGFGGDYASALAAYNGGPGSTLLWAQLANGDPDLLLETIRFDETRRYLTNIYEFYQIYRQLYEVRR